MNERTPGRHGFRAAVIVTAVTLLALVWPVGAPLYAMVYPGPDAHTVQEAITDASLDARFDSEPVTQFETATFRATVIYGISTPNPDLPTVKVAWSNEAALTAPTEGTFVIEPTSASRQYLDAGTRLPNGGYALTWTWNVTPLVVGRQELTVSILPTVVVEGQVIPGLLNINKPVPVTVDVHPVQHDFDEVLTAAAAMKTDVPGDMVVGDQYTVSASMSLAGHAGTVSAVIDLEKSGDSAKVTIVEASGAPAAAPMALAASGEGSITRLWTVTCDEPGQVNLVFTATLHGQAATHVLERKVPKTASARATMPPPSIWDRLSQLVAYINPFVALAAAISGLGLWAWLKKRKQGKGDASHRRSAGESGDRAS